MTPVEIDPLNAIQRRLSAIERSNRRLRAVVVGLAALPVVGWLAGSAASANQGGTNRPVQTQQLVIVGSDNQPRAMLTGSDDGASFFLYGRDAYKDAPSEGGGGGATGGVGGMKGLSPRMRFTVAPGTSKIEFLDGEGKERLLLLLDDKGPTIQRLKPDGTPIED